MAISEWRSTPAAARASRAAQGSRARARAGTVEAHLALDRRPPLASTPQRVALSAPRARGGHARGPAEAHEADPDEPVEGALRALRVDGDTHSRDTIGVLVAQRDVAELRISHNVVAVGLSKDLDHLLDVSGDEHDGDRVAEHRQRGDPRHGGRAEPDSPVAVRGSSLRPRNQLVRLPAETSACCTGPSRRSSVPGRRIRHCGRDIPRRGL